MKKPYFQFIFAARAFFSRYRQDWIDPFFPAGIFFGVWRLDAITLCLYYTPLSSRRHGKKAARSKYKVRKKKILTVFPITLLLCAPSPLSAHTSLFYKAQMKKPIFSIHILLRVPFVLTRYFYTFFKTSFCRPVKQAVSDKLLIKPDQLSCCKYLLAKVYPRGPPLGLRDYSITSKNGKVAEKKLRTLT